MSETQETGDRIRYTVYGIRGKPEAGFTWVNRRVVHNHL